MPNQQFKAILVGFLLMAQMTISIFGGMIFFGTPAEGKIRYGISVHNIDLGGLSTEEGLEKLQANLSGDLENVQVRLTFNGKTWILPYQTIDVRYDLAQSVQQAQRANSHGGWLADRLADFSLSRKGLNIPLQVQYDQVKLEAFLQKVAADIDHAPAEASLKLVNTGFQVTPGFNGQKLDVEAARTLIDRAVREQSRAEIELAVSQIPPDLTADALGNVKDVLAVAVTVFDPKEKNRVQNIKNAAEAVDGTILKPGEEFSFNRATGPRLATNGYLEAPVIKNRVLEQDFGGGVCQVATTLYQAALLAELNVVERRTHSIPPAYVPIGQDAVVDFDRLDLRFKNDTPNLIYINAEVSRDKLMVRLFGSQEQPKEIKLVSEDIQKVEPNVQIMEDPRLLRGTSKVLVQGQAGYSSKVYREYLEQGQVVKKELISSDYYPTRDTVMVTGTRLNSTSNK